MPAYLLEIPGYLHISLPLGFFFRSLVADYRTLTGR